MVIINPVLEYPPFVIPAKAGIHSIHWAPAFAGATLFKGRVNNYGQSNFRNRC